MIRIVRTRTLRETDSQVVELHDRAESERTRAEKLAAQVQEEIQVALDTGESLLRTQDLVETLSQELTTVRDELAHAQGELAALNTKHLLDAEDRVVLRMLLRTARKQEARADRVHILYRFGVVHSVHVTRDAAEIAAETEGADRSGWTSPTACCVPDASDIPWRIQSLSLGGTR